MATGRAVSTTDVTLDSSQADEPEAPSAASPAGKTLVAPILKPPSPTAAALSDIVLDASQADLRFMKEEHFHLGCDLLRACSAGAEDKVVQIIESLPIMTAFSDYDRRTALHVAASEGRLDLVRFLLDVGTNPNRSDRWGGSPLDDALRHRHMEVAELLRGRGGRLGVSDRGAALIFAASRGETEEVKALLLDGADANGADYDARTPLHLACSEGHEATVEALLAAGANPNAEDRWQARPIDDARLKGNAACASLLMCSGSKPAREASPHLVRSAGAPASESASAALPGGGLLNALDVDWSDVVVVEKIGAGAFGDIFKVRWRGTLVAAKMLKPGRDGSKHGGTAYPPPPEGKPREDPERAAALADLRQEIGLLGQLRHPNICLLLGFSLADDREVMLAELMRCSLLDVLKTAQATGAPMKPRRALRYAIQFAQGMNYLHTCRPCVLHRDLKPANLLLDFADTLKVSDFGLAKLRPIGDGGEMNGALEPYLMTGETGSYRFMAPEVFRHEAYGRAVDVYSFALIAYNMLLGEAPWPDLPGPEAAMQAALKDHRPHVPRHWDAKLAQLIRSSWAADPAVRPSFAAVLEQLNEVFRATTGTSYEENLKKGPAAGTPGAGGCCVVM